MVRIVIAVAIGIMIYFRAIEGVGAIVAGVIAAYLLITGLVARCLFYKMADIDTTIQEQPYSSTDDRAGL